MDKKPIVRLTFDGKQFNIKDTKLFLKNNKIIDEESNETNYSININTYEKQMNKNYLGKVLIEKKDDYSEDIKLFKQSYVEILMCEINSNIQNINNLKQLATKLSQH